MYRLLLVDDEPFILEGLKCILDWSSYGFSRVETAANYYEAIEKALELRPHLAILDICIGAEKGYELIERLNMLDLPTKYIVISGHETFEFVRKSFKTGVLDYLLKPIDRRKLQQLVEKLIVQDLDGCLSERKGEGDKTDPVLGLEYASLSNLSAKVLLIIEGEYQKNLSLKQIADKFMMNSKYLGQIFTKETGTRFSQYLMMYRLTIAREKIMTTSEKISSIALSVGYSNLNYFYTHFKAYFGISPTSFREDSGPLALEYGSPGPENKRREDKHA